MFHTSLKHIKGHNYLYAIRSIRLPSGKISKLSKLIQHNANSSEVNRQLDAKEIKVMKEYALRNFPRLHARDPNALEKIEMARIEYTHILRTLSKNQLDDLFNRFTVNFTYESNAIEGNSLTLKDVSIILNENIAVKGKELREIYETRNCREVIQGILDGNFKVNENDIQKMHSILVRDMGIAEGYKTVPNYIHLRQVVTAPPERVAEEMANLLQWFEENKWKLHPLQLASTFHGRFERIHPFEDGNGRVGRFIINLIITSLGYPPLIIRKTNRLSYFNALEDFDNGRSKTLETFLFERFKETSEKFFHIYMKYLK